VRTVLTFREAGGGGRQRKWRSTSIPAPAAMAFERGAAALEQ
jgi:hypothetical protein